MGIWVLCPPQQKIPLKFEKKVHVHNPDGLPNICSVSDNWLFSVQVFFYEMAATFCFVFCTLNLKNGVSQLRKLTQQ